MDKTKFALLVGILLALFFFVKMDADAASVNDYRPSIESYLINEFTIPEDTNIFRFKLNTEGVVLDDGTFISYVGDTAVIDIDSHFGSLTITPEEFWNYDYATLYTWFSSSFDLAYTDYSNGLATINQTCTKVMPYVVVNGEKKYIANNNANSFVLDNTMMQQGFAYGIEVQIVINYSGAAFNDNAIIDSFGISTLELKVNPSNFKLYGIRYISTGDKAIVSKQNSIIELLTQFKSSAESKISEVTATIKHWQELLWNKVDVLESSMVSKFDELIESLTRSYDSSSAESTNSELSGSLDSWEAAEGATMDDAKIDVSSYDTSSAFNFAPALISSLSLVTAFSTGFLNASGDFTTAITVMFSLVFVSVLVGLVRFVRR